MAHSLSTPSPPAFAALSPRAEKKCPLPFLKFQKNFTDHRCRGQALDVEQKTSVLFVIDRRTFIWGLTGAILGSATNNQSAHAAKRRPPPPPPTDKKDPNLTGVQAKVVASIKRKEAMKEAMAKLREQGKPVE